LVGMQDEYVDDVTKMLVVDQQVTVHVVSMDKGKVHLSLKPKGSAVSCRVGEKGWVKTRVELAEVGAQFQGRVVSAYRLCPSTREIGS
jgi:predicted RNA-binding protein with RPS1 domain